jgi:hypothetical protein
MTHSSTNFNDNHNGFTHQPPPILSTPPDNLYRTLVLCFDGTGDEFVFRLGYTFVKLTIIY